MEIGFLIFLIALAIFLSFLSDNEKSGHGLMIFLIVVSILAIFAFTMIDPITWFASNITLIVLSILGYGVAGGIWSLIKWSYFANSKEMQTQVKTAYENYVASLGIQDGLTETSIKNKFLNSTYYNPLHLSNNTKKFIRWIAYWPFNMFWTCTYKFLNKFFIFVKDSLINIYESIGNYFTTKAIK